MNIDVLLQAQQIIFDNLREQELSLSAIRLSDLSLIHKWQMFLSVILPLQIEAIKTLGLGSDQHALARFNEACLQASLNHKELKTLNEQKWTFLFEKVFGLTIVQEISLELARMLVHDIAQAMVTEDFLLEVDVHVAALPDDVSLLERRQKLLTVLIPLHMSIMQKYGFVGEEGYVQAQRALMDYYHDPVIMQQASQAQIVVFKRSRLIVS